MGGVSVEESENRKKILRRIAEFERRERWNDDVEDDPESKVLLPNMVDYLNKKITSKVATGIANIVGTRYFEKLIKNSQIIIKEVRGIENYLAIDGGAVITCNHFNPCDNYAIYKAIKPYLGKRKLYKVIKEGNYTNYPGLIGFLFRHCNTLPLSSNKRTMVDFVSAIKILLERGEKILVYPEQAMWWNYRKPRPLKSGAFKLALANDKPVIPMFITMEDTEIFDPDGFRVQAYTINILPAIYPQGGFNRAENVNYMMNQNYTAWKDCYESFYGEKLVYSREEALES